MGSMTLEHSSVPLVASSTLLVLEYLSWSYWYPTLLSLSNWEHMPTKMEQENTKISTIVLTCCYFVFILPVFMVEWIPPKVGDKERGFRYWEPFNQTFIFFQALIVAIIYSVYWLVYVVNVFVYVIYLPRCRDAICFMVKDLASPVTDRLNAATIGHSHTTWGPQVADRKLQEYTLSGINQDSNDFECTRF